MKLLFLRVRRTGEKDRFTEQTDAHAALAGNGRLGQSQAPAGQVDDTLNQRVRDQLPLS